jgi:hypothetical protein
MWPGDSAFHTLHEIPYKNWRPLPHQSVPNNNRQNLDILLHADDHGLLADSEDNLQLSLHNLDKISKIYDLEISHKKKTEVLAFRGKDPVSSMVCLSNNLLKRVTSVTLDIPYLLHPKHIPNKPNKFIKTLGTITSIIKPLFLQKHARI